MTASGTLRGPAVVLALSLALLCQATGAQSPLDCMDTALHLYVSRGGAPSPHVNLRTVYEGLLADPDVPCAAYEMSSAELSLQGTYMRLPTYDEPGGFFTVISRMMGALLWAYTVQVPVLVPSEDRAPNHSTNRDDGEESVLRDYHVAGGLFSTAVSVNDLVHMLKPFILFVNEGDLPQQPGACEVILYADSETKGGGDTATMCCLLGSPGCNPDYESPRLERIMCNMNRVAPNGYNDIRRILGGLSNTALTLSNAALSLLDFNKDLAGEAVLEFYRFMIYNIPWKKSLAYNVGEAASALRKLDRPTVSVHMRCEGDIQEWLMSMNSAGLRSITYNCDNIAMFIREVERTLMQDSDRKPVYYVMGNFSERMLGLGLRPLLESRLDGTIITSRDLNILEPEDYFYAAGFDLLMAIQGTDYFIGSLGSTFSDAIAVFRKVVRPSPGVLFHNFNLHFSTQMIVLQGYASLTDGGRGAGAHDPSNTGGDMSVDIPQYFEDFVLESRAVLAAGQMGKGVGGEETIYPSVLDTLLHHTEKTLSFSWHSWAQLKWLHDEQGGSWKRAWFNLDQGHPGVASLTRRAYEELRSSTKMEVPPPG